MCAVRARLRADLTAMSIAALLSAAVVSGVVIYLVIALLRPEWF